MAVMAEPWQVLTSSIWKMVADMAGFSAIPHHNRAIRRPKFRNFGPLPQTAIDKTV